MEEGCGIWTLCILEEGGVNWTGGIVESDEHHPSSGADRWGLSRDLDTCDENNASRPLGEEVLSPRRTYGFEERNIEVDDMTTDLKPENLELSTHSFGTSHLRESGKRRRSVVTGTELKRELNVGRRLALLTSAATPLTAASLAASSRHGVPTTQLSDVQEQIPASHPVTSPHRNRSTDGVEGVECSCNHQTFGYRSGHCSPVPEISQRLVGAAAPDSLDLCVSNSLDVGQRQPDAIATTVRECRMVWDTSR